MRYQSQETQTNKKADPFQSLPSQTLNLRQGSRSYIVDVSKKSRSMHLLSGHILFKNCNKLKNPYKYVQSIPFICIYINIYLMT